MAYLRPKMAYFELKKACIRSNFRNLALDKLFGQRPQQGTKTVEWGKILSVCPSSCLYIRMSNLSPPPPRASYQALKPLLQALRPHWKAIRP